MTDLEAARTRSFERSIRRSHILVTTGAGGVGKTTTAAALGLAGAAAGRRTLVLTIDPARRLAQAMGLPQLDNTPRPVPLRDAAIGEGLVGEDAAGGDDLPRGDDGVGGGSLWAMMLDMRSTFDSLIDRHAGSRERAEAIKGNRIYQTLSSTLSGTQEYMAMERLHELHDAGEWDLIVVDTPPTRSALDFLDAPKRMTAFLEGRLLKLILKPGMAAGRGYLRAVNFGATTFMKVAGRVTGMDLLSDLAEFFRNFEGMYDGFKERAEQVLDLLQRPSSQFVVVTSPEPPPLREAKFFLQRLEQEGLHGAGVAVNRIQPELVGAPPPGVLHAAARAAGDDEEGRAVGGALRLLADVTNLAERQRRHVDAALFGVPVPALVEIPLLRSDVHDLATLDEIAHLLAGASPVPATVA